jgi:selenide,water dikinase
MLGTARRPTGKIAAVEQRLGLAPGRRPLKREKADEADVLEAVNWMKQLNNKAGQLANEFNLRAGTDVTGYSLLGHAFEMASASSVALRINFQNIPFISCARKYADAGCFAGGAFDNKKHFEPHISFAKNLDEKDQMLMFDPQTSGGLLLGVPRQNLEAFIMRAKEADQPVWVVGSVEAGTGITVR